MIVPEIVGKVNSQEVSDALSELLPSDNQQMVADLRSAMGDPGAADRLAREISDYLVGLQSSSVS